MRYIRLLSIILTLILSSCNNKKANNEVRKKEDIPLKFEYIKDSVFVYYKDSLVFGGINKRKFSRDSVPKNLIFKLDKDKKRLYLYNFGGGMHAIFLKENENFQKKLPQNYSTSNTIGNDILIANDRIILHNKMYAIIYDSELNELFFPFQFISSYRNHKYNNILEANYHIVKDSLKAEIRYLENFEKGKDTIFRFPLYEKFPSIPNSD